MAISAGASGNRIGTDGKSVDDVGERNVIGGSGEDGVDIYGTGTDGNVVAGNFIGTDVTGTVSLGIFNDGVFLAEGASSNWIGVNPLGGTAASDEGNVIPGNDIDGVQIVSGSDGNTIAGNKIGTDASGTVALHDPIYYRFNYGVEVDTTCVGNTIGGLASGAGNLISGNWTGIGVSGAANLIEGNLIGTDSTGTAALGNQRAGIDISGNANTIGGTATDAGNLISGNEGYGILITGAGRPETWSRGTRSAPTSPAPSPSPISKEAAWWRTARPTTRLAVSPPPASFTASISRPQHRPSSCPCGVISQALRKGGPTVARLRSTVGPPLRRA